jgi:hypothetical protein
MPEQIHQCKFIKSTGTLGVPVPVPLDSAFKMLGSCKYLPCNKILVKASKCDWRIL